MSLSDEPRRTWAITGETYTWQATLRRLGCVWAPEIKAWVTTDTAVVAYLTNPTSGRRMVRQLHVREI
jgi:hypothetical protein